MWYVIQVTTGREQVILQMCNNIIEKGVLKKSFVPQIEKKYKYNGKWLTIQVTMFPGYVFVETDLENKLFIQLKNVPEFTKIIRMGYEIVAMKKEEEKFLKELMNEKYTVTMSEGIIIGDHVIVYEGPLKGKEGYIRKIDRKKRMAILEIDFLGRKIDFTIGLEIIMKYKYERSTSNCNWGELEWKMKDISLI